MTDWSGIVDRQLALRNCRTDILRDWYYDPWGWPELEFVVKSQPEILFQRLNSQGTRPSARLDVAKEGFSIRPAVVLDPVDRLAYQALVDTVSEGLIGEMSPHVFGWRLPTGGDRGVYADNGDQNESFRERLTDLANTSEVALKTDIVSCFASVPIDRLLDSLVQVGGSGVAVTSRLVDMLSAWDRMDGRSGLPQRSLASCVLANFYLQPIDELLEHLAPEPKKLRFWVSHGNSARWMDDIWLFGGDAGFLRGAQVELQKRMEEIGLRMNTGKTDVIEGREALIDEVLNLEHSAVDDDLAGARSLGPLNDLVDSLLVKPEASNRTSVRFATIRMRREHLFDRVGDFAAVAERLPHASDGLARLFRDSEAWRDLGGWYVEYQDSDWGSFDWASAQFGRMFPTSQPPPEGLIAHLGGLVVGGQSMAITALALQRLATWDSDVAVQVIRERRGTAAHPLERRLLALGALQAGADTNLVRNLLGEFEENQVTLSLIEDRDFKPLQVEPDFAGD